MNTSVAPAIEHSACPLTRMKFSTRKLKEYYPHQSADSNKMLSYRRETALQGAL